MALNNNIVRYIIKRTKYFVIHQQIRNVPRWSHRRPVEIIVPEEYDKVNDKKKKTIPEIIEEAKDNNVVKTKIRWNQPKRVSEENYNVKTQQVEYAVKFPSNARPISLSKSRIQKQQSYDMLETTIDEDGNFIYTKMADNDRRISMIMVEVKSKKEKEKKDLILLEGKRLIKEALDAKCKLQYLLFTQIKDVEYLRPSFPKTGAMLYKMPYKEMQLWSDLTTNQGIMGIFKIPDTSSYELPDALPITIICDNLREPGNLGAVLRTASGVGCQEVILTKGCTNLWDTKVLRSACGGHFKLRLKSKLNWDQIKSELSPTAQICIADNNSIISSSNNAEETLTNLVQSVPLLPYYGVNFSNSSQTVLIIGGETEGISEDSYQLAVERKGVRLNVPLSNNVDSLNTGTAFGIIAFEMKRQFLTSN